MNLLSTDPYSMRLTPRGVTETTDPYVQLVDNVRVGGIGCYELLNNRLRNRFETLIEVPNNLATLYSNEPEQVPEDAVWARFEVVHEEQTTITSGNNGKHIYRKRGLARTTVFVPLQSGDNEALEVIDFVDVAFRDITDQIIYHTPRVLHVGQVERWYVTQIDCPWRFDEVRPPQIAGGGFDLPGFETLHNAVRTRFSTLVETPESVTTLYDNDPQQPPEDGLWVRWSVRPGESIRVENGGAPNTHRYRTPGIAVAQVFFPLQEGENIQLALIDVIVPAFRGVTAAGVTYQTPRVQQIGKDGRWWQINVVVNFYADVIA